ncbi:MAG: magnesium-transporting ATPase, partial [Aphanocapsa feldmannii 277cI]
MEPLDPSLMSRLPIAPGESIFARGLGRYILRVGVVFAAMTIVMMLLAAQASHPWKTMVFTTLCLAQMFHALSCRTELPLLQIKALSNPWLLWAVVSTTLLQLCLIYVASLRNFFGTDWLSITELGICFGFSALLFLYLEVEKLLRRRC